MERFNIITIRRVQIEGQRHCYNQNKALPKKKSISSLGLMGLELSREKSVFLFKDMKHFWKICLRTMTLKTSER